MKLKNSEDKEVDIYVGLKFSQTGDRYLEVTSITETRIGTHLCRSNGEIINRYSETIDDFWFTARNYSVLEDEINGFDELFKGERDTATYKAEKCFLEVHEIISKLEEDRDKYKTLWNSLKERLHLGILEADGDWDISVAEQILKEMNEEEEKVK